MLRRKKLTAQLQRKEIRPEGLLLSKGHGRGERAGPRLGRGWQMHRNSL